MFENNVDVDLDLFIQAPGACATGFANGVLQDLSSEVEISRDAAAKSYFDFVRHQYFGIDENYDPFVFGERLISEENDDAGLKHLRIAAGLGNSKAMLRIGEILTELDFEDDALPWLRLAKANGEEAADRLIEANEDSRWLDDDDDDDEDDAFRIV
jgi:TPR repeat protein